jgi:hypothetical protein
MAATSVEIAKFRRSPKAFDTLRQRAIGLAGRVDFRARKESMAQRFNAASLIFGPHRLLPVPVSHGCFPDASIDIVGHA